ncbi:MAG TPA: hypothetical protein ENG92_01445 [Thiolapillus brandeum]|uniref:Anti-sigma factor n=1 Tax=Thiolapillus brandeum TaxID=1076588 RepID=A0A831KB77_9GAMM|nr:hypothetical protein [Thiolapillus brandeum]
MMKRLIDWEALNAYIDGELSPADAAEIARAVMLDKRLAIQVAELTRLKAVTSELQPCSRPEINLGQIDQPNRWYSQVAAWLILPLTGALLSTILLTREPAPDSSIVDAEAIHHQWLNSVRLSKQPGTGVGQLLQASINTLQLDAYAPDLSKVNLMYAETSRISMTTEEGHGEGVHIGYLGPNGCKVSLVVSKYVESRSSNLQSVNHDGRTVYRWRIKRSGFYLLASHMDPRRLDEIAKAVYRMTRTHTPLNASATLALNKAKSESTPCTV